MLSVEFRQRAIRVNKYKSSVFLRFYSEKIESLRHYALINIYVR